MGQLRVKKTYLTDGEYKHLIAKSGHMLARGSSDYCKEVLQLIFDR